MSQSSDRKPSAATTLTGQDCRSATKPARQQHARFDWTLNLSRLRARVPLLLLHAPASRTQFGASTRATSLASVIPGERTSFVRGAHARTRSTVVDGTGRTRTQAADPAQPSPAACEPTRQTIGAIRSSTNASSALSPKAPWSFAISLMCGNCGDPTLHGCTSLREAMPTVDAEMPLARALEPGTAPPPSQAPARSAGTQRRRHQHPAREWRRSSQVPVSRHPGLRLERTIKAIAVHGARFVGCNVMAPSRHRTTHALRTRSRRAPSSRRCIHAAGSGRT